MSSERNTDQKIRPKSKKAIPKARNSQQLEL